MSILGKVKTIFCNAQTLQDSPKNTLSNMLINRNYRILNIHPVECIELNLNKIPKIKNETEE